MLRTKERDQDQEICGVTFPTMSYFHLSKCSCLVSLMFICNFVYFFNLISFSSLLLFSTLVGSHAVFKCALTNKWYGMIIQTVSSNKSESHDLSWCGVVGALGKGNLTYDETINAEK